MKVFGSKWTAAAHYPQPAYDIVYEPFAGSAGYSLRHFDNEVYLRESHKPLASLWAWLIEEATESDIKEIPLGLPEGTDIRIVGLSEGQALLLRHWQRTNNFSECWTVSAWGNKPGQWTANTRSRVAEEHTLIKHWKINQEPPTTPKTFFIDPPYQYNYQYGVKNFDYDALGDWTASRIGQVIACEAICPKTGNVPNWLPFEFFRSTVTSRRKAENNHHSKELIYHAMQT